MKAIAAIVLMVGMLKFAMDAPELLKKLFSFGGGLLDGLNLNPRGQLRGDLQSAGKAIQSGANLVATPFRSAATIGKGAAGAVRGAISGAKAGGSTEDFAGVRRGIAGGARGLVSGARAGANNQGFRGTMDAAENAGTYAGRISHSNSESYGNAQKAYHTTIGSIMDVNKVGIDKQKDAKKELEAQYKSDRAQYINDHIKQHEQEYIERAVNNETEARLASEAAAANMTVDAYKQSKGTDYIESVKNAVMNDNTFMSRTKADAATDAAAQRAGRVLYEKRERDPGRLEKSGL